MKKKITALALAAVMVLGLTACGGGAASSGTASTGAASSSTTDVAFVTDVGNIDDQSFNQYTWAGVQQFADANGLNANYYKPSEDSDAARVEQMDNAVKDGAKVIVMAGYLFAPALEEAQAKYPDISFLALDVSTGDLAEPAANTALITYKEEQAGYLAGYAAVTDGYKNLGFLGGMAVPLLSATATVSYRAPTRQLLTWAFPTSPSSTGIPDPSRPTMISRPRWTAGIPMAQKSSSRAAAPSATPA